VVVEGRAWTCHGLLAFRCVGCRACSCSSMVKWTW
jgi:hypothetical protein